MGVLITIIGAILAIFIVIVLHEAGHFFVAKLVGVKILRFSIGFGKALWSRCGRDGTEYVLAILPLGGYVKMLDDREIQVSQQQSQFAYNRQPLLARMAIVLAGPFTNFLLALIVFWVVFLLGVSYIKPVIGKVLPHSIAETAGLKVGDTIKEIDGVKISDWQQVLTKVIERLGSKKQLALTIQPSEGGTEEIRYLPLAQWKLEGNKPDIFKELGIEPFEPAFPAVVAKVMPNSPAQSKDLRPGDKIIDINGKPVADWPALMEYIRNHPRQEVNLTLVRDDQTRQITLELGSQSQMGQTHGYLGIEAKVPSWPPSMIATPDYSLWTAWIPAAQQTWHLIAFNYTVLEKMIMGKISVATLGGPITIFRTAGEASKQGLRVYLNFIAFISVTLGFLNILPIPGLDGGHFLFQVIESVIGRPISERYQALLLRMGIILIILLIIQSTINDIIRLF